MFSTSNNTILLILAIHFNNFWLFSKENQIRSSDMEFRLKNQILIWTDLETLNQLSFEAKVQETIKI